MYQPILFIYIYNGFYEGNRLVVLHAPFNLLNSGHHSAFITTVNRMTVAARPR